MKHIYFDNAATTAPDASVIDLMADIQKKYYANASSVHRPGNIARDIIEEARNEISSILGIQAKELYFTSGATEAINTILYGAVNSLGVKRIISSKIEHSAVLKTLESLKKHSGTEVLFVKTDISGKVDFDNLEELLKKGDKTLVCLMHVNNELGNITSPEKTAELCRAHGALYFSDTVQSTGKLKFDMNITDFAVGSAHKFHGPKGTGFMYIKNSYKISPLIKGGPQERNMRAGTENIAAVAGMSLALKNAVKNLETDRKHIAALKNRLIKGIETAVPEARINGDNEAIHTIANIGLPMEKYGKMVVFNLDIKGIAVSGGSACSSGVMETSHVIKALGIDKEFVPLRVSFSKYNTEKEVDRLLELLKKN